MNTLPAPRSDQDFINATPVDEQSPQSSPIKLHKLLSALRRFWWVAVLTTLTGLGIAAAVIRYMPPTFVSKALMWETPKLLLSEGSRFSENTETMAGTQRELLQSTLLRELALARIRLGSNSVNIPLDEFGMPVEVPIRVNQAARSLAFTLEASGSAPRYIRAYLDAIMEEYIQYKKNIRLQVSGGTLSSVMEQVQRYARDLKMEQDAFTAFQRSNDLFVVQQEGAVAGTYLATLKAKLSEFELEDRMLALSLADSTSSNTAPANPLESALFGAGMMGRGTAGDERLAAFRELHALKLQRDRLARYLKPQHPKMLRLGTDINRGEQLLLMYRDQSRAQLAAARQTLQLKIENVQNTIAEWEIKVIRANSKLAEADRLKANIQRLQQQHDRLDMLVQNIGISRNIDQETLEITDHASEPERSYSREIGIAGLGGAGGLGLGLGIILLVALRDDRFGSAREVCELVGNGVVGQVPEVKFNKKNPLLPRDCEEQHMYVESYRNIRSALLYLGIEGAKPKVILVTSAMPDEGKSTVCANLAHTLALGGARVLLVDGDLRKGTLHRLVGLNQAPGFADLLRDTAEPGEVLQTNSLSNLHFIASGKRISNAGDLFVGKALDDLLRTWREQYDHVIIDSTPVFAADDASTFAPKADGTLLVVRNRFSRSGQVKEALELLMLRQAKLLGVVFNRANADSRSYHYYKYKEYYGEPVGKA